MRFGAHVPTRGGLMGAIESARAVGAEAVQIWGSNPRAWAHPNVSERLAEEFAAAWTEAGIGPLFLHAPYTVNVASPNLGFRRRAVDLARATVRLADAVGAEGVVVHAGSAGAGTDPSLGLAAAAASLATIADAAERTGVLVELTAGGAGSVASTFREARALFDAAGMHERLGLCADTCHLFAAGYALDTSDGAAACFRELQRVRLAGRLRLVHANDSAFGRGAHRDRHANVGRGLIAEAGFRAILRAPAIRRCPVVCETPGTAEDRARDIRTLRRLAGLGPLAGTHT